MNYLYVIRDDGNMIIKRIFNHIQKQMIIDKDVKDDGLIIVTM